MFRTLDSANEGSVKFRYGGLVCCVLSARLDSRENGYRSLGLDGSHGLAVEIVRKRIRFTSIALHTMTNGSTGFYLSSQFILLH